MIWPKKHHPSSNDSLQARTECDHLIFSPHIFSISIHMLKKQLWRLVGWELKNLLNIISVYKVLVKYYISTICCTKFQLHLLSRHSWRSNFSPNSQNLNAQNNEYQAMSLHWWKVFISMNGCTKYQLHLMSGSPNIASVISGPLALHDSWKYVL